MPAFVAQQQLLTAQTANVSSIAHSHTGGSLGVWVWGTFDGCIITLEARVPGADVWVPVRTFAAAVAVAQELPPCDIRLSVSGDDANTAPSLNGYVKSGA